MFRNVRDAGRATVRYAGSEVSFDPRWAVEGFAAVDTAPFFTHPVSTIGIDHAFLASVVPALSIWGTVPVVYALNTAVFMADQARAAVPVIVTGSTLAVDTDATRAMEVLCTFLTQAGLIAA